MRRTLFPLALLSLSLIASRAALADPVVNGGFEDGAVSMADLFANPDAITGWTATNVNFMGVESTAGPDADQGANVAPHSGTYSAVLSAPNFTGNLANNGTLSQTITDNAGDIDTLTFWLASQYFSGPDNYFSASIANASDSWTNIAETGTGLNGTYDEYSLNFTATGSDTILFSFFDNDSYFSLDDVSVTVDTPAPGAVTPEPSTLMLLGTGLASLAGVARRRFAA